VGQRHCRFQHLYLCSEFQGNPDKLLDLARAGQIELHITDDILGEVLRVLKDTLRTTRFWTARLPENPITSLAAINTC